MQVKIIEKGKKKIGRNARAGKRCFDDDSASRKVNRQRFILYVSKQILAVSSIPTALGGVVVSTVAGAIANPAWIFYMAIMKTVLHITVSSVPTALAGVVLSNITESIAN